MERVKNLGRPRKDSDHPDETPKTRRRRKNRYYNQRYRDRKALSDHATTVIQAILGKERDQQDTKDLSETGGPLHSEPDTTETLDPSFTVDSDISDEESDDGDDGATNGSREHDGDNKEPSLARQGVQDGAIRNAAQETEPHTMPLVDDEGCVPYELAINPHHPLWLQIASVHCYRRTKISTGDLRAHEHSAPGPEHRHHQRTTQRSTSKTGIEESLEDRAIVKLLENYLWLRSCAKCEGGVTLSATSPPYDSSNTLRTTYLNNIAGEEFPEVLKANMPLSQRRREWTQPSQSGLRRAICGKQHPEHRKRPYVDLNVERPKYCPQPRRTFDFDSIIGRVVSLAACRQGIDIYPYSNSAKNWESNLHIKWTAEFEDGDKQRRASLDLRHVPHYLFGRVSGPPEPLYLYIIFPKLYNPEKSNNKLPEALLRSIYEDYVATSIAEILPSDALQHHSLYFNGSKDKATAKQTETRSTYTASYQGRHYLSYNIPHEYLEKLWDSILSKFNHGSSPQLQDPQLIIDAKNLKLALKSPENDGSLLATLDKFFNWLDGYIDANYVDGANFYADLGIEITPPSSARVPAERQLPEDNYQTYFFKRCCLRQWRRNLYGKRSYARPRFFNNYLLRDAVNMTCDPSPKSPLYQAGVRWSQWYGVQKEILDAAKVYPFQNPRLEEIGLSDNARTAIAKTAKAAPLDKTILQDSWDRGKQRTVDAMNQRAANAFGVRHENRIGVNILFSMKEYLQDQDESHVWRKPSVEIDVPDFVWIISTSSLAEFVKGNVNKFCAGVEMAIARGRETKHINWAQTQFIVAMIRMLRFFVRASDVRLDMGLAIRNQKAKRANRVVTGLNLLANMKKYGFGWPEDLFDWRKLAVRPKYTKTVTFASSDIRARYIAYYGKAKDTADDFQTIDTAFSWLRRYNSESSRNEIILFLAHLILRQFRRDVFTAMGSDIIESPLRQKGNTQLSIREQVLTYDAIMAATKCEPYLLSGLGKTKLRKFTDLFSLLFGLDNGQKRGRWETLAYRSMLKTVTQLFEEHGMNETKFWQVLKRECVTYHWLYPRPNALEFHQVEGHQKARPWWSLALGKPQKMNQRLFVNIDWEDVPGCPSHGFAKLHWVVGHPPPLPRCLERGDKEWTEFLSSGEHSISIREQQNSRSGSSADPDSSAASSADALSDSSGEESFEFNDQAVGTQEDSDS